MHRLLQSFSFFETAAQRIKFDMLKSNRAHD